MSMFNIADQLNGSFEELMAEIRAMRRELERVRAAVEAQSEAPAQPRAPKAPRATRATTSHARPRKRVA